MAVSLRVGGRLEREGGEHTADCCTCAHARAHVRAQADGRRINADSVRSPSAPANNGDEMKFLEEGIKSFY